MISGVKEVDLYKQKATQVAYRKQRKSRYTLASVAWAHWCEDQGCQEPVLCNFTVAVSAYNYYLKNEVGLYGLYSIAMAIDILVWRVCILYPGCYPGMFPVEMLREPVNAKKASLCSNTLCLQLRM